ncbi:MAG: N-6 DNA methylase [Patescibacteria group bacterium]|jgi:tRNA1(Val) A37 N6-methylase TrmN6
MDKNRQKQLGAFYTPQHTVEYMVNKFVKSFTSKSNLLEPSGGDGAFVSKILEKRLLSPQQITVWDINPETNKIITKLGIENIVIKDTLLETSLSNSLFNEKQEFSHIIGNPPYLNKQSGYIKKNKGELKKIYKEIGANDTYAMFLYLSCRLLKIYGELCFIISDTFLTLGIHKNLRKFLLTSYTINEITICPKNLFKDTGASVNTCIIYLKNKKPDKNHFVVFNDCRNNQVADYSGIKKRINQREILNNPDYIFGFNGNVTILNKMKVFPKLVDFLNGGLGMHTTNNKAFLGVIDYRGRQFGNGGLQKIPIEVIKASGDWKFYHKKGGDIKYFSPVEYCIKWDKQSIKNYKISKNLNLESNKDGFIISGICSSLSARIAERGALWESNKAMCFFPKDPLKYPPEFFVGILNSNIYNKIIKLLNHTNSIQIRDIKKLPMPNFKVQEIKIIASISENIIKNIKKDLNYNFEREQKEINKIVSAYFN